MNKSRDYLYNHWFDFVSAYNDFNKNFEKNGDKDADF